MYGSAFSGNFGLVVLIDLKKQAYEHTHNEHFCHHLCSTFPQNEKYNLFVLLSFYLLISFFFEDVMFFEMT